MYVTDVPGTAVVWPSVLVIDRSASRTSVSVSVAELLPGVGSVNPPGGATVAVLASVPEADAEIVAVSVNVAVPPAARLTVALMLPEPPAGQLEPVPAATHVHVAPPNTTGNVSVTVAPVTNDGPALVATIVYVTGVPGTSVATPSVFVIERSPVGVSVSESVAELLVPFESLTPDGGATVAVLTSRPVAVADTVPDNVNVAVAPTGRLTADVEMLPDPDAGHEPPPAPTHVHDTLDSVPGTTSDTDAPVTADGPAFDTTTVYVTDVPGTAVVWPSVLVIPRSACGVRVSVSVAVLLPGVGSVVPPGGVTVAVLASVPVADAATLAVSVNVAVPAGARLTVALMLPEPLAGQVEPVPAATHVHVAPLNAAGNVSVTVAPVTNDGPPLVATIVYVTGVPGTSAACPSVFVIDRSAVGVNVSVSDAELFAALTSVTPAGTDTVTEFTNEPVAVADSVPVSVNVAVAPTGRLTAEVEMLPAPDAGHEPPPAPTHVHDTLESVPGTTSDTVAPTTADGPALEATIVYVTAEPGTADA